MNSIIVWIVGAIVLIGGGFFLLQNSATDSVENVMMKEGAVEGEMMNEGEAMMAKDIVVTMSALNASGETGTATLSDVEGKAKVVINLAGAPLGLPQPAHIHVGSCPNPGAVKYPLSNVIDGKSETMLSISIDQLLKELPLAVNVHKSAADLKTYVSCGDIIQSEAMMKKDDAMMDKGDTMMVKYTGTVLAGTSALLLDYNKADYDAAIAGDKLVVLYFYDNWCQICKA